MIEIFILIVGFYMAWNIGANDVSNAMGTSVGSGALTLRRAVVVAAILEFSGAFFVGANVSETMQRGLIDPAAFSAEPMTLVFGMCGALLGTSIWLQIASYFGWPVSTTHAIVGAILGVGALLGGWEAVLWEEVISIGASWVVSPLLSGLVSYLIFTILQRKILYALNPVEATRKFLPLFFFIVFTTFTLSLIFNGLENLHLTLSFPEAFTYATGAGVLSAAIAKVAIQRAVAPLTVTSTHSPYAIISLDKAIKHLQRVRVSSAEETQDRVTAVLHEIKDLSAKIREETILPQQASEYHFVEKMFVYLQIITACYVAFAHGANDVSNAIGPVAAVLDILHTGTVAEASPIAPWLLALGGLGIVLGLATWGWRVIETIGRKITELTPTRGFCAEFGAATTILIASKLGLPVSTTHCLVGAVLGVGLARGITALNLGTLREIILSWIITIPASASMGIGCFYLLRMIF